VLRAVDILDRPPAQCVLIGDSVTDIEVSRATGLRSIG
jgi:beta-phosphoglucomutase-like phosphatase (HAD superfamily)